MTSQRATVTWLLVLLVSLSSAKYDPNVCVPSIATVPLPGPEATLGEVYQAVIEWKDDVRNRTYIIQDYADMPDKQEKLVISLPLKDDVTVLYDWSTQDVIVEETVEVNPLESQRQCRVVKHSNTGDAFTYQNKFWLTSLQVLMQKFVDTRDAILNGTAVVRGIRAQKWTACVYDYYRNVTALANLYFSDRSWLSPYLPPDSAVPVRLEYTGRQHTGSDVTDVSLVGDIISFKKRGPENAFPPELFTTHAGSFCPGRTGQSIRFPVFPSQLSLLMELVDIDFTHISYQQLWYDSSLQMARWDSKPAGLLQDSNTNTYLMDFRSGIKYTIDRYMMTCSDSLLTSGDDFTTVWPNGSLAMMTTAAFFHAQHATIQYVGQATVRDVVCNTWIGRYFDQDANRNNTVQWYFTTRKWAEATGNVEGGGAFFMMKVWKGGSGKPAIYNIMRYSPSPPDFRVFDFSPCYGYNAKKHFTIEFQVSNMKRMAQVSRPYLRSFLVQKLAGRLMIQMNRFTDVTLDLNSQGNSSSVFLSGMLLGALRGNRQPEVPLEGAFVFLKGSIDASHLAFNLTLPDTTIIFTGISLVEHNFRQEFATTTTTTIPLITTKIVAPTLVPPKKPTTNQPPTPTPLTTTTTTTTTQNQPSSPSPSLCPTTRSCTCPKLAPPSCPPQRKCPSCPPPSSSSPSSCPPPTPCPSSPTTPCPTLQAPPCSCATSGQGQGQGQGTATCPPPVPSPTRSARSCQCASTSAPTRTDRQMSSSGVHISSGALAGAIVATLLLGLAVGIVATRLFHRMRASPDNLTINLMEDI